MIMKPIIFGLLGTTLTPEERAFFTQTQPLGFILFKRNLESLEQIKTLVDALKGLLNHPYPHILIDQEGGRVQRLNEPLCPSYPPNFPFGTLYHKDPVKAYRAVYLKHFLMGHALNALGINVNCVPVLDCYVEGADNIIGDRAFSTDPDIVSHLAGACLQACYDVGVTPVIKHIPTHGPAKADSHKALPILDLTRDELEAHLQPFRDHAAAPWAMTAHIIYKAFDAERPATLSPYVIQDIIRKELGFDGFLLSDDITMKALDPLTLPERAIMALDAGCDALIHWNGKMDEMAAIADAIPPISDAALGRLSKNNTSPLESKPPLETLTQEFQSLMEEIKSYG